MADLTIAVDGAYVPVHFGQAPEAILDVAGVAALAGKVSRAELPLVTFHGAIGDGVTPDHVALNAFIAGGGLIEFPPGNYRINSSLNIPSNTHIRMAPGARLIPGVSGMAGLPMINITGTAPAAWVALTSNIAANAKTWVHTSNAYTVGQWVEFRSNALVTSGPNIAAASKISRLRKIIAKSGSGPYTYTLNKPVYEAFNTADGAEVGLPTIVENVTLENVTLNEEDYTSQLGPGMTLAYCAHIRIINPTMVGSKAKGGPDGPTGQWSGIGFSTNVFDVEIKGAVFKHLGWYGISVGPSEQVRVRGGYAEDVRHAVSVVYNAYGDPTDIHIQGMTANRCTLSGMDTHDTGRDIVFDGCVSIGSGDEGFQFRTHNVRAIGCTARGSTASGFADIPGVSGTVLDDCLAVSNGVNGYHFGGPVQLNNCDATSNTFASGAAMSLNAGGRVTGGRFTGNAVVLRVTGDAPLLVEGIHAPADATQTQFGIISGSGRWNKVRLRDNYLAGYVSSNYFLRSQSARTAGDLPPITSGNIVTDGAAGAEWSGEAVLVAGTVTVTTSAARRVPNASFREAVVSKIDLRRIAPGGTVGDLYVESVTSGTGFVIRSTNAADTSTVQWTVDL